MASNPILMERKKLITMKIKQHISINELPEVITAQNIADHLGISRRRVYELFQLKPASGGIPNFEIGLSKRVEKKDFIEWIDAKKKSKSVS